MRRLSYEETHLVVAVNVPRSRDVLAPQTERTDSSERFERSDVEQ